MNKLAYPCLIAALAFFSSGCGDNCSSGETRCQNNQVQECRVTTAVTTSRADWVATLNCGSNVCVAVCSDGHACCR
jgi:hypothetical protein